MLGGAVVRVLKVWAVCVCRGEGLHVGAVCVCVGGGC